MTGPIQISSPYIKGQISFFLAVAIEIASHQHS
jgi:hypothetical protein